MNQNHAVGSSPTIALRVEDVPGDIILWPSTSEFTGAERRIVDGANPAANCLGIAPIPSSGNEASPIAKMRNKNLKNLLEVFRFFSRKTPENQGRKKRSTMSDESPHVLLRYSRVVDSGSCHSIK
jgi:hypothetical protein